MKAIFQASQAGWVATYSSTKSNILHGMKARTGRNNKEQLGLSRVEREREKTPPPHITMFLVASETISVTYHGSNKMEVIALVISLQWEFVH